MPHSLLSFSLFILASSSQLARTLLPIRRRFLLTRCIKLKAECSPSNSSPGRCFSTVPLCCFVLCRVCDVPSPPCSSRAYYSLPFPFSCLPLPFPLRSCVPFSSPLLWHRDFAIASQLRRCPCFLTRISTISPSVARVLWRAEFITPGC